MLVATGWRFALPRSQPRCQGSMSVRHAHALVESGSKKRLNDRSDRRTIDERVRCHNGTADPMRDSEYRPVGSTPPHAHHRCQSSPPHRHGRSRVGRGAESWRERLARRANHGCQSSSMKRSRPPVWEGPLTSCATTPPLAHHRCQSWPSHWHARSRVGRGVESWRERPAGGRTIYARVNR